MRHQRVQSMDRLESEFDLFRTLKLGLYFLGERLHSTYENIVENLEENQKSKSQYHGEDRDDVMLLQHYLNHPKWGLRVFCVELFGFLRRPQLIRALFSLTYRRVVK
jgi:hypothetical protein